jgi:hypothetical protein
MGLPSPVTASRSCSTVIDGLRMVAHARAVGTVATTPLIDARSRKLRRLSMTLSHPSNAQRFVFPQLCDPGAALY